MMELEHQKVDKISFSCKCRIYLVQMKADKINASAKEVS